MFEVIEELVNPSHYIVRIKYSTDKSKGGGKLNEISDIKVSENDIEIFLNLINTLKETLSSGSIVVPDDYYGDYILEKENYYFTIDVPVINCSFSSYFYKIESIDIYFHEKHTVKKVKIK